MRPLTPAAPALPLVDRLRADHAGVLAQTAGIAVFTLLMVLGAQVRIPLFEVPFTLQTLAVYGAGLFLGARSGALSGLLYLVLGLFLPVFAGAEYGAGYLLGATGGYLVALPLVAFVAGRLTEQRRSWLGSVAACLASLVVLFTLGLVWFKLVSGYSWGTVLARGLFPFVLFDLAKIGVATFAYAGARRLR
ncbi:MAG TPA: biotin transporter BioY [Rhodothermales bacterium]|nr:biotin transporter BioY [Rhodothermales bacterium]